MTNPTITENDIVINAINDKMCFIEFHGDYSKYETAEQLKSKILQSLRLMELVEEEINLQDKFGSHTVTCDGHCCSRYDRVGLDWLLQSLLDKAKGEKE